MPQDWGEHASLIGDIEVSTNELLAKLLGQHFKANMLQEAIHRRIEGFLDGVYTAQDTAGLIVYDVIRLVHKHGDLCAAVSEIMALESNLIVHLKSGSHT